MTSTAVGGEALRRIAAKVDRYEAGVEREAAHTRAGASAAAELTQEIRALRDTLAHQQALNMGADKVEHARGRPLHPDTRSRPSARSASAGVSGARAGRPGGADGVADPSALAAGDDTSTEGQLRRELRRMTEAYATLVKETRLYKAETDSREKALEVEIGRLKQAVAAAERAKRDQDTQMGSVRGLREELAAANATITNLKERITAGARYKEREAGQVAALEKQLTQVRSELEAARTTIAANASITSAAVATEAKLAATSRQLAVAAEERDVLLDHVQELQRKYNEADGALRATSAQLATASARLQDMASVTTELQRLQAQVTASDAAAAAARAEAQAAKEAVESASTLQATVEELQHVQAELLRTISSQATELEALKRSGATSAREAASLAEASSRDARRFKRLERMLDEYRAVEKEFIRRTGQGFWGPVGLAHALWADAKLPGAGASALGSNGSSPPPAPRSAAVAAGLASESLPPEASDDLPVPLFEYLQRLEANLEAEARARLTQERQAHDAAVDTRMAGLRAELAAAGERIQELQTQLAACGDYKAAVARAEAEVAALLESVTVVPPVSGKGKAAAVGASRGGAPQRRWSSSPSSSELSSIDSDGDEQEEGEASAAPSEPALDSEALSRLQWRSLPTLHAMLPRIAGALDAIRAEFSLALRRRRIAETEAVDLREEVAGLRSESHAQELVRGMTALDVKVALRDAKLERTRLQAEAEAATARLKEAEAAAAVDAERVARYRARVRKAKELLQTYADRTAEAETARQEQATQVRGLQEAVASLTQRVQDVSAMNAQALAVIHQRDATVGVLRVKLRTLQALVGPGGTAAATAALRAEVDAARARLGMAGLAAASSDSGGIALGGDFQDGADEVEGALQGYGLPAYGSVLDETAVVGGAPASAPATGAAAVHDPYAGIRAAGGVASRPAPVPSAPSPDSSVSLSLNSTAVAASAPEPAAPVATTASASRTTATKQVRAGSSASAADAAQQQPRSRGTSSMSGRAMRVAVEALPVPSKEAEDSPTWYLSPTPRGSAAVAAESVAAGSKPSSKKSSSGSSSSSRLPSSSASAGLTSPPSSKASSGPATATTSSPATTTPSGKVTSPPAVADGAASSSGTPSTATSSRQRRHRLDEQLLAGGKVRGGEGAFSPASASSNSTRRTAVGESPAGVSLFGTRSRSLYAWEEVLSSPNTTALREGGGRGSGGEPTLLSGGDTTLTSALLPEEELSSTQVVEGAPRSPVDAEADDRGSPLLDAEALGLLSPATPHGGTLGGPGARHKRHRHAAAGLAATSTSFAVSTPSPSGATRRMLPVPDVVLEGEAPEVVALSTASPAAVAVSSRASRSPPTPPSQAPVVQLASPPPSSAASSLPKSPPQADVASAVAPALVAPAFSSAVTVAAARGSATDAAVVVAPTSGAAGRSSSGSGSFMAWAQAGAHPTGELPGPDDVTYTVETQRVVGARTGGEALASSPPPVTSPTSTLFTVKVRSEGRANSASRGAHEEAAASPPAETREPRGVSNGGARRPRSVSRGAGLRDAPALAHQPITSPPSQ